VRRHAVLGGELDGQVDWESVGVVEFERDLAQELRGVRWELLGRPADDSPFAIAIGPADQAGDLGFEELRPGIERPRELGLLARDHAQDLIAPRHQVRVGLAHHVDDDGRRLGHEGLAPAQEAGLITLLEAVLNPFWVWLFWHEEVAASTWVASANIFLSDPAT